MTRSDRLAATRRAAFASPPRLAADWIAILEQRGVLIESYFFERDRDEVRIFARDYQDNLLRITISLEIGRERK